RSGRGEGEVAGGRQRGPLPDEHRQAAALRHSVPGGWRRAVPALQGRGRGHRRAAQGLQRPLPRGGQEEGGEAERKGSKKGGSVKGRGREKKRHKKRGGGYWGAGNGGREPAPPLPPPTPAPATPAPASRWR